MQNTELPTRLQTDPNFRQPLTRREVKQKMLGLGYSGTQFRQLYRLAKDKIRNTGIFSRYGVRDAARNALYNNFPKVVHRSPDEVEGIAQQRLALQDAANKMVSEIQPNSNYFSVDISKYNTAPEDISVEEVLPESATKPVIAPRYKDGDDFTSMGKFDNAFALARKNGMKVFTWNGKKYGTKMDPNWRERWGRVESQNQPNNEADIKIPDLNSALAAANNDITSQIDNDIAAQEYEWIRKVVRNNPKFFMEPDVKIPDLNSELAAANNLKFVMDSAKNNLINTINNLKFVTEPATNNIINTNNNRNTETLKPIVTANPRKNIDLNRKQLMDRWRYILANQSEYSPMEIQYAKENLPLYQKRFGNTYE